MDDLLIYFKSNRSKRKILCLSTFPTPRNVSKEKYAVSEKNIESEKKTKIFNFHILL
jgi:hypothetical protein